MYNFSGTSRRDLIGGYFNEAAGKLIMTRNNYSAVDTFGWRNADAAPVPSGFKYLGKGVCERIATPTKALSGGDGRVNINATTGYKIFKCGYSCHLQHSVYKHEFKDCKPGYRAYVSDQSHSNRLSHNLQGTIAGDKVGWHNY